MKFGSKLQLIIVASLIIHPTMAQTPGNLTSNVSSSTAMIILAASLDAELKSKADAFNGVLTNPTLIGSSGVTVATGQNNSGDGPRLSICPTSACYPGLTGILSINSLKQTAGVSDWGLTSNLYSTAQNNTDSDVAAYFGAGQGSDAAGTWSLNTNIVRGASPTTVANGAGTVLYPAGQVSLRAGTVGYELDFSNFDQNTTQQGQGFTVGEFVHNQSFFTSQDAIYLDAFPLSGPVNDNAVNFAWNYGISMYGVKLNKAADIYLNTSAGYAVQVLGAHTIGLDTTSDASIIQALNIHSGQRICLKGESVQDCLYYNATSSDLEITNNVGSANVIVQDSGNVVISGSVTQAGRRDLQFSGIAITNNKGQSVISFGTRPDGTNWFAQSPSIMATPTNIPLTESVMVIDSTATTVTLQFYKTSSGTPDGASLSRGYTIRASGS